MTSDLQLNTASADADPLDEPGLRETADPTPMYRRDPWRRRYRRNLALTDLFSLVWVVYGTQLLWFGLGNAQVAAGRDSRISDLSYWVFSAILIVTWMWALSFVDSRSDRVIGTGSAEYVRIADASFRLFGTVAIIAFLTQIDVARGYLLISLPLGILVLIFTRWMWRQWLVVQRSRGLYSANVLLVGSLPSVTQLAREFGRSPSAGYRVVGACVPNGKIADVIPGTTIPVMGHVGDVTRALQVTGAGRATRKFSLDELPQLFNVIGVSMSLVGPHPPLPSEVAVYADHVHRRFLAKPGITGLWQVSDRSSLSWEESVRLDLSYVENWTLLGDFVILGKTARAALAPGETAA